MRRTRRALVPEALIVFYLFNMMEYANQPVAAEIKHTLRCQPAARTRKHTTATRLIGRSPGNKNRSGTCRNKRGRDRPPKPARGRAFSSPRFGSRARGVFFVRLTAFESLFCLKRPCFLQLRGGGGPVASGIPPAAACCRGLDCCRFITQTQRARVAVLVRNRWKGSTRTHAKINTTARPRPPAHPRHMLSQAFKSFAQTSDWSQQASEGSLFTSPQQVNILHLASSSWKSERREGELSSFMTANSVCVCMNEAKK